MADTALQPAPSGNPSAPGQIVQPTPEPPPSIPVGLEVAGGLVVATVLALIVRSFVRPPKPLPPEPRPEQKLEPKPLEQLPPKQERLPEIPLQPSAEREKLTAEATVASERAETQRKLVQELEQKLGSAAPEAQGALKAELEARQKDLKDLDEERKKAEYRLKKVSEVDEKERKRTETEAQQKAEADEQARIAAPAAAKKAAEQEVERKKIEAHAGRTLADGLNKTRSGFMAALGQLWGGNKQIDEKILDELEHVLFGADIGVRTAQSLLDMAREKVKARDISDGDKLKSALRGEVQRILAVNDGSKLPASKPLVLMVVGVNGAGKTTTIGKLAAQYMAQGKKVVLGAGDTFRAAASEQLEVWADRAKVPIVRGAENSNPGAVVFDAIKKGVADGVDVVICDTAGRLHTQEPLMEELKKVKRAMDKALPGAPHEVLLVLDSTNGQNAIAQAQKFHEALAVTGIALTKLDGTAKGGVIIGICDELKIPVRYVGVGEGIEDLRPFQPAEFVEALFQ